VGSPTLAEGPFRVVAEREFPLRGPAERVVSVRIGVPEPDAQHPGTFRCPFQVTGLSDDSVQHAYGVDSFQALNLALVGVRHFIKTNATVLAAFHEGFSLTWEDSSWEVALPVWVPAHDADQLRRLERFLETDFWSTPTSADDR
jgi:hypothetical protein